MPCPAYFQSLQNDVPGSARCLQEKIDEGTRPIVVNVAVMGVSHIVNLATATEKRFSVKRVEQTVIH